MRFAAIAGLCLAWLALSPAAEAQFADVCPSDPSNLHCREVGKHAYNAVGAPVMRTIFIGPIIGVAWRPQGSLISRPEHPPRTSPRDAWYFIIGPGGVAAAHEAPFLREAREIAPRKAP